jgi:hypothetical protein
MKKKLIILVLMIWSSQAVLLSQETWVKIIGGGLYDGGKSISTTTDGGYVLTGHTESIDRDFRGMNKGGAEIFVIKLDSRGELQWKKSFGGSKNEIGISVTTTPDGGFILSGATNSYDGNFKKDSVMFLNSDLIFIKFDSLGDVQWGVRGGGTSDDHGTSSTITPDGGYVVTGHTKSNNGDYKGMNKGEYDVLVMKLDSDGNIQWNETYGGSRNEESDCVIATKDGGYVVSGFTESNDGDFEGMGSSRNVNTYEELMETFIIKLDKEGDVEWSKTFGTSSRDQSYSVTTTPDGGYVLTGMASLKGMSASSRGEFNRRNKGGFDIFVLKLDSRGNVQWDRMFGGTQTDWAKSIINTTDGGLVITGSTSSNDGDFEGMNMGGGDVFVIKLDQKGDLQWKKTYGGSGTDRGYSIISTPDGGYAVTGETSSTDGIFKWVKNDGYNIFVMKLDANGNLQTKDN